MHGQSIFGLPSKHSLYSLISKRCYIFDDSMKKNLLNFSSLNDIFTAWMTYYIIFHGLSFLLRSKIHWFLRFDLRGRFEVVRGHISKCPQMILIPFSYNPNIKMTNTRPPWAQYKLDLRGWYGGCWGWVQKMTAFWSKCLNFVMTAFC